jgi:hypothetical protein
MERLQSSLRSVHGIGSQASVFSPLLSEPNTRPSYLSLDSTSLWETSALQMTALESLLLPTRLREPSTSLANMEEIFTAISSRRNVVQASMSIENRAHQVNGIANGIADHVPENDEQNNSMLLDMGLFATSTATMSDHRVHCFSKALIERGHGVEPGMINSPMQSNNDPIHRSYFSNLQFPCPSSFPNIFQNGNGDNLKVKASLEATTYTSEWLRTYADQSRVLPVDEREDVSSDFRAWADEYVEGWESGGDDDWDD